MINMVIIDKEFCKSCKICKNVCPKDVFEITSNVNKKGYNYMEAVRQENCIACGICETSCPDFAIYVEK